MRIEIVDYDERWALQFLQEKAALEVVLAPWLNGEIEHIGSTAVIGLAAKPVIDIMAPIDSLVSARPALEALKAMHYLYSDYRTEVMHWFCKPSLEDRTHHLHLVPKTSALWNQRLMFRDALRQSSKLLQQYAELKRDLASKFPLDREAYTEAKSDFVSQVLANHQANIV